MITFGDYIRIILDKKGLKQQDLVNRVNESGMMGDAIFTRQKLSNILNGIIPLSQNHASKIEIALDIPKGSLKQFVNTRR